MLGGRNLCQQLVPGVALQSLRDLHEPGCKLGQHILIVRIAHSLSDLPGLPSSSQTAIAISIGISCRLIRQA